MKNTLTLKEKIQAILIDQENVDDLDQLVNLIKKEKQKAFQKGQEAVALDNEDHRKTIYRDGFDAGYIGACKDCVNITGCDECKSEI